MNANPSLCIIILNALLQKPVVCMHACTRACLSAMAIVDSAYMHLHCM